MMFNEGRNITSIGDSTYETQCIGTDDTSYRTHIAPIASTLLIYTTPVSMLDLSHMLVTIESALLIAFLCLSLCSTAPGSVSLPEIHLTFATVALLSGGDVVAKIVF